MKLLIVDVWIEGNTLMATIWVKGESGEVAMFQQERHIKILERLVDKEALTGLYLLELAMTYGEAFYE